jgi:hypothetical protein
MAEIYAVLRGLGGRLDIQTPQSVPAINALGDISASNLVLIGGRLANALSAQFQEKTREILSFEVEAGVLLDNATQSYLTPIYTDGAIREGENVCSDYGVLYFTPNPFTTDAGKNQALGIIGVKGNGTRAAALVASEQKYVAFIAEHLEKNGVDFGSLTTTPLEIVVKVEVRHGMLQRDSISIEKIRIGGLAGKTIFESEHYKNQSNPCPYRFYVYLDEAQQKVSKIKMCRFLKEKHRFSEKDVHFKVKDKPAELLYILISQAKEDYRTGNEKRGKLSMDMLIEQLWPTKLDELRLPEQQKRELSAKVNAYFKGKTLIEEGEISRILQNLTGRSFQIKKDVVKRFISPINERIQELTLEEILSYQERVPKDIIDMVNKINTRIKNESRIGEMAYEHRLIESEESNYFISVHPVLLILRNI